MVSEEKIAGKFLQLEEYVRLLKEIGKIEEHRFLKDKILIGSAKYYLQISIECCLDVANHITASETYRAPRDYADSFSVLEEESIIPGDLAKSLRKMAKFRNRLVHLYGEIDDAQIYRIIQNDLKDFAEFQKAIILKFDLVEMQNGRACQKKSDL